jgi:hypothetical protein
LEAVATADHAMIAAVSSPVSDQDTTYAMQTLEQTPSRAVRFLWAIGTSMSIRTVMSRHGYRKSDHDEGWQLVQVCCTDPTLQWPDEMDETAQDALIEVDQWDERGFAIVTATLSHKYPAQARFLLSGIGPSEGPRAVDGVRELLDRIDALERGATEAPDEDKKAVAALGKRGLGKRERARLGELVDIAERAQLPPMSRAITAADPRFERLVALRAWYDEWSEIARATISRTDHLVRMGLVSRRDRASVG